MQKVFTQKMVMQKVRGEPVPPILYTGKGLKHMILFLTSSPTGAYRSEKPADFKGLNPANGMVEELRRVWKDKARCLLIAAFPDAAQENDAMRAWFAQVLADTGLSAGCVDLCDSRNAVKPVKNLDSYDMILLSGGHVPTEMAFFDRIGLPEKIRRFEGIVMGISAGSMNCAEVVYAQPEMPGEAVDPSYRKFIPGLGLTPYNILPHYQAVKEDRVDGLRLMEEITYPDSAGHSFYAIPDGSYLLQETLPEEKGAPSGKLSGIQNRRIHAEIRGEAYLIRDGKIRKLCEEGKKVPLP